MLLSDAELVRRQVPCPSSLSYISLVTQVELLCEAEYFESPQKWANLTCSHPTHHKIWYNEGMGKLTFKYSTLVLSR
jgi:hypothetical protein